MEKTTIAEEFARNEYESYILMDFSVANNEIRGFFDDISKLDRFFLKLQLETGVELKTRKDDERLFDLIDSGFVLPCYNVTNPSVSLSQTRDVYRKLLSDKLPADLGYLYENVVAQMIKSSGRDLYYHTWRKKDSTHSYDIVFAEKYRVMFCFRIKKLCMLYECSVWRSNENNILKMDLK